MSFGWGRRASVAVVLRRAASRGSVGAEAAEDESLRLARAGVPDKTAATKLMRALCATQDVSFGIATKNLKFGPLHMAVYMDRPDVTEALLLSPAPPPVQVADSHGVTPLHLAAGSNGERHVQLLLQHGAATELWTNMDMGPGWSGLTPLHLAAHTAATESTMHLVDGGADVNSHSTKDRDSPLILACRTGAPDVVRLLLQHDADCNYESNPLVKGGWDLRHVRTPLIAAVDTGCVDSCAQLIQAGTDVNWVKRDNSGQTALHHACLTRKTDIAAHTEIVRLLVDAGANVNVRDTAGSSPLDCTNRRDALRDSPIAALLRQHNAQ